MKANAGVATGPGIVNKVKWLITFGLLISAVIGNHLHGEMSVVIRAIGVIILVGLALGVAATTAKGKVAINFSQEARMEVRKVIWPTRQETIQTTIIVLVVCIIMALALWGIDGIMVRLVSFITGA